MKHAPLSLGFAKAALAISFLSVGMAGVAQAINVIETNTASIAPTGAYNLENNALIVHTTPYSTIYGYLATGINLSGGGWWNGFGINSSVAALTAADNSRGIGGISNNFEGSPIIATFAGRSVVLTDTLVRYTWMGDADLDGIITPTDQFLLDNGVANSLTGWLNGDFDYDGALTPTDQFLLDNAFSISGGNPLVSSGGKSVVATPEPSSVALLAIGATAFLGRRRSRQSLSQ